MLLGNGLHSRFALALSGTAVIVRRPNVSGQCRRSRAGLWPLTLLAGARLLGFHPAATAKTSSFLSKRTSSLGLRLAGQAMASADQQGRNKGHEDDSRYYEGPRGNANAALPGVAQGAEKLQSSRESF